VVIEWIGIEWIRKEMKGLFKQGKVKSCKSSIEKSAQCSAGEITAADWQITKIIWSVHSAMRRT
jgi:hypothetical protein